MGFKVYSFIKVDDSHAKINSQTVGPKPYS